MFLILSFTIAIGMAFLFPAPELSTLPKETVMWFIVGKIFLLHVTVYSISLTVCYLFAPLLVLKREMKIKLSSVYLHSLIGVNFSYGAYAVVDYMSKKGFFYFDSFIFPLMAAILANFYWNKDLYMRTMHVDIPDEVKISLNKLSSIGIYGIWFVGAVCLQLFF